ncbi:hypothetical protein F3Y22_tig00111160pilonHSYRG00021 [Hibiscus syriacus]|uniref:Sulfotransferase n=1 Tax=Hibiscus syriacus TaxID=106335 RepID=A0A6A2YX52_HIBSY|nr:hypothetical protein F3Y22_tig00111160pilonHSYRG00021 [Hibiscus syriacus]
MLCSFPKTGTTWLKSLIFSIITRTLFDDSTSPLLYKTPNEVVPFMELDHAHFSTHRELGIPVDPKYSLVSLYHFNIDIQTSQNTQAQLPALDEAFELFCKGESLYGPYWTCFGDVR